MGNVSCTWIFTWIIEFVATETFSFYRSDLNDTPCGAKMVPKINANKITVNNSSVKTIF